MLLKRWGERVKSSDNILIDTSPIVEFTHTGGKGNYAWIHPAKSSLTQYIDDHGLPNLYIAALERTKHS